jgi:hypothetical protein
MILIHQINDMNHDVKLVSQVKRVTTTNQPHCHLACHISIIGPLVVIIHQKLQESMKSSYYLILDDYKYI